MRTYTILSAFKSSVSMGLLTLLLLIGTFTSYSQTTPANCTQGCTSSDVHIISAYLSNQAGVQLDETFVCPESGSALVYLTLELATNTPRQGVSIFANVKTFTPPSTIGSTIYNASECFGILLNQPTNKVTFQVPFNWPCTSSVVLTDIFIAWGTGNKNFCTGTEFQCPATPSKCYQLPPGEFISVGTPSGNNAELKECESSVGSGSAIFDLTDAESTVIGSQTNVTVRWYSDAAGTTEITGSNITSYNSSSTIVYAKVCSNASPLPLFWIEECNINCCIQTYSIGANRKLNLFFSTPIQVLLHPVHPVLLPSVTNYIMVQIKLFSLQDGYRFFIKLDRSGCRNWILCSGNRRFTY